MRLDFSSTDQVSSKYKTILQFDIKHSMHDLISDVNYCS